MKEKNKNQTLGEWETNIKIEKFVTVLELKLLR